MDNKKIIAKLLKIANNQQKIIQKLAQTTSAQAGDVENALKKANLWELAAQVSPLLNEAGVPDDASVAINIIVDKGPMVKYAVLLNPPNAGMANKLAVSLNRHYSAAMSKALKDANLNVDSTITVNWLKF